MTLAQGRGEVEPVEKAEGAVGAPKLNRDARVHT